jgi:hypothetical protein
MQATVCWTTVAVLCGLIMHYTRGPAEEPDPENQRGDAEDEASDGGPAWFEEGTEGADEEAAEAQQKEEEEDGHAEDAGGAQDGGEGDHEEADDAGEVEGGLWGGEGHVCGCTAGGGRGY